MTKKFVIIGGTGRLGHMLKYAAPPSTQLLWQSRSSKNSDIEWHFDGNIEASAEKIAPHIENAQAVLCLAGLTHTSSATSELTQAAYDRANVELPLCLQRACLLSDVPRLLVASSAAVYGYQGATSQNICENAPLLGKSLYALSKQRMERALIPPTPNLETCVLRIGNVAGADQLLSNLHVQREPLQLDVFDDNRSPARPYIGPRALGEIISALMASPKALPHALNVSLSGHIEMRALLQAWNFYAQHPIEWHEVPASDNAVPVVGFDTNALSTYVDLPNPTNPADFIIRDLRAYQETIN